MNDNRLFLAALRIPLLLAFLLLPLAQERIMVFWVPVYTLEWLTLVSGAVFLLGWWKGSLHWRPVPGAFFFASVTLVFSVALSMLVTGVDRTSLGVLKSWFFFPSLFAFLLFQGVGAQDREKAIRFWFIGTAVTALLSMLLPDPFSAVTYDGRLRFIYPSPNHLALFLVPGILLGGYLLVSGWRRGSGKTFCLSTASLLLAAIIALFRTESIGGAIATIAGGTVFLSLALLPLGLVKKVMALAFSLYVILPAIGLFSLDWGRLGSGEVRTPLASRIMIWNASLEMLREHPVFGIGPGKFQDAYLALQPIFPPYLEWAVPHAHDIFLMFAISAGLLGLLSFLALVVLVFRAVSRSIFSAAMINDRLLPALLFSLLYAILVHGLVDTPYFRNDLSFVFWAIVAFAPASFQEERK